jgi:hypothetical protein
VEIQGWYNDRGPESPALGMSGNPQELHTSDNPADLRGWIKV